MIFKHNNLLANIISYFILSEPKFEYDAFVIYSSYDSDWVIKTLIPVLERKLVLNAVYTTEISLLEYLFVKIWSTVFRSLEKQ